MDVNKNKSVDFFFMNKLHHQFSDLLAFPLWSHMSSAVDSRETEISKFSNVPHKFSVCVIWPFSPRHRVVLGSNPLLGAFSRYSAISVARVVEQPIFGHENRVNPHGALKPGVIVVEHCVVANLKFLNVVRNVKGLTDRM